MKQITLSLMVFSLLILASCGGGSGGGGSVGSDGNSSMDNGDMIGDNNGDGGSGGGGGNNGTGNNGDGGGNNGTGNNGGGGELNIPAQAEWIIMPLAGGLSIQWHNLNNFTQMNAPQRLSINLTRSDTSMNQTHTIDISDFINGIYQLTGLEDGIAYKFASMIELEYGGNISHSRPISLLLEFNRLDNAVNGIVVGANHDGDGRADGVDADDDNDGKPDDMDACRLGGIGWNSDNTTLDYDSDGCRNDEDLDGDNDGVLNENEAEGCELNADCDNDNLEDSEDSCPAGYRDWSNDGSNDMDSDGCRNDEDVDDDGDGLIEIGTAVELDAVRYVLDGRGLKVNATAEINQTGCGNGMDITVCNGYELVRNISLTNYIIETYSKKVGWKPIAHDVNTTVNDCQGDVFTGVFDGNDFEINGLFINRSTEDCIGLFGQANGTIRHLELIAGTIIGNNNVGSLIGNGKDIEITHSCVVSSTVRGSNFVGGMVGGGQSAKITQSCAVSGEVKAVITTGDLNIVVGGLAGWATSGEIIQSYAVSGTVSGGFRLGGLVGESQLGSIIQSYAVSGVISGNNIVGGMVGNSPLVKLVHSYAVSGSGNGGGLVSLQGGGETAKDTYWDIETSGITNDMASGSSGQTTSALRSPTGYTGIYATWDDGVMVDGINDNITIWCDEDSNGSIEGDERRDDNKVWDFGTTTDYPALRCTSDSLTDQRAWWYLNITSHKPQLNQTRLDAYLDGTLN